VNHIEVDRPLGARVRDTFFAPARLFSSFGDSPPWADVLALATILAVAVAISEPAETYLALVEDPVTRRGEPVEITSSPAQVVLFGRVMSGMNAVVGHPLIAFGIAGLLSLVFTVIGRGSISFRQYLAIAAHGLLILSVGMVVALFLRLLTGNPDALPTLGAMLPVAPESSWVGRVLDGINLFTLWMLGVVALGVASLERRVTRAGAATLLWGGYGALVVAAALLFRP
jgi:hypothetical protein